MPNPIESQIKERLAAFVAELDQLVRKSTLESLQAVLARTEAAPARRGRPAGAKRGPGRPRGSGKANLEDASAAIVAHVRANDGQGISAIADATGVDLKTAKKAAIQLLATGALKKSGQKRGTVYHVGGGRAPRAAKAGKRRGAKRKAVKAKRKPGARKAKRAAALKTKVVRPTAKRAKPKAAAVKPAPAKAPAKAAPVAAPAPSMVAPG